MLCMSTAVAGAHHKAQYQADACDILWVYNKYLKIQGLKLVIVVMRATASPSNSLGQVGKEDGTFLTIL